MKIEPKIAADPEAKRAGAATKAYSMLLALLSLPLVGMGGWLLFLRGSPYFALAGAALLLTAFLVWRGDRRAGLVYGLVLLTTLLWTLWEVGSDPWSLVTRLAAWIVVGLPLFWIWLGTPARRAAGFGALALAVAALLGGALVSPVGRPEPFSGAAGPVASEDWSYVGRTAEATRYAPFAEVNTGNVNKLKVAWTYRAGSQIGEATPLKIGDALYFCTFDDRIVALDAETGAERWRFDPKVALSRPTRFCRGVAYHQSSAPVAGGVCQARLFTSTRDARLIAVDAKTGRPCPDFGRGGTVNLKEDMGPDPVGYQYSSSPPLVAGDVVVVGTGIYDGQSTDEPSGVIRAFDARTGALAWAWDIGRPGVNTAPPPGQTYVRGTPNVWSLTSYDPKLGLIYLPTGNAPPDYFGAHRTPEMEKFTSSVVALDARDGSVRWHFQTVHHDLWDYDVASQPVLTDFPTPAGPVPAVIQATKRGDLYVLDRRTGVPLTKVEERPVPQGAAPGDFTSPTQPFSVEMPELLGPPLREADMWGLTPFDQLWCRIRFREARYEGEFTPPGLKPTLEYPTNYGVYNWGSVSVDEKAGVMVAPVSHLAIYVQLFARKDPAARKFEAIGPGGFPAIPPEIGAPQRGTPYAVSSPQFFSPITVPCNRPPYGGLAAIDLKTRKVLWQRPVGTTRKSGPFGLSLGLPLPMGVPLVGGALVTGGDLSFFSGSQDGYVRALSTRTGRELWRASLPAGSNATPMTYRAPKSRRQIVLVSAGGSVGTAEQGDYLIAYALPGGAE
jgi:quinate dehydrogenase (quinone)